MRESIIKSNVKFILTNPSLFSKRLIQASERVGRALSVFRNGKWQGAYLNGKTTEKAYE